MYDMLRGRRGRATEEGVPGRTLARPRLILRRSVRILEFCSGTSDDYGACPTSTPPSSAPTGSGRFFAMLTEELSDDYLAQVEEHLSEFKLPRGVLLSARLGLGNKGEGATCFTNQPGAAGGAKMTGNPTAAYGFDVDAEDLAGAPKALSTAGRTRDQRRRQHASPNRARHFQGFFERLRMELAVLPRAA